MFWTELKENGAFVGRTGLIRWDLDGEPVWEVGYTLATPFWGKGLATEAAMFWKKTGFRFLSVDYLVSLINSENKNSIHVAKKNGMTFWKKSSVKNFPVDVYRINRGS